MSTEDLKRNARRYYEEVVNRQKYDLIDELVTSDFYAEAGPEPTHGPKAFKELVKMYEHGFSDTCVVVEDIVSEGDKVIVRGYYTGKHTGEFMGIPATNKPYKASFCDWWEVKGDRFSRHWSLFDAATLFQQLGVMPQPETAQRIAA